MKNKKSMDIDPVIGYDLLGYPFNKKYPPDIKQFGNNYDGYETKNKETFFLDFAVEAYQVLFSYNGKRYLIEPDEDDALVLDPDTHEIIQSFPHANALIEQMQIEGESLLSRIEEVEVIEIM